MRTLSWRFIFALAGIGVLFLLTRFLNLTALPIFTDEAIYIRWAQIGGNDAYWRFISLTDGKQPLFIWVMMVFLRFIKDPLVAGRVSAGLSGIGTLIGLGLLSFELFRSKKIVLLSLFLYVISPFSVMYDRLALYDSLVTAFSILNLYVAVRLAKTPRLDIGLILGITLGIGMLNKTSAFLSLYLLPFTLILFPWGEQAWRKKLRQWILFAVIAAILSQGIYGILRLSPYFHMIAEKDFVFVHPLKNFLIVFPFFQGNLRGLFDWAIHYLTIPIFILCMAAVFIRPERLKEKLLILLWWFLPFAALAYFGKVLYPRFVLFMTIPLLVLGAYTIITLLQSLGMKVYLIIFSIACLVPALFTSYLIVTNPLYAPIPSADRGQMIDDWPSGWGVNETNALITREAQQGPVAVFTEGTFGLFPYALEMYHWTDKNVTIKGIWPLPEDMPQEVRDVVSKEPTYLILNQTQIPPKGWPLRLLGAYQKGTNPDVKLRIYQVVLPYAIYNLPTVVYPVTRMPQGYAPVSLKPWL